MAFRRSFRRFGRRRVRRRTAWVPGLNFGEGVSFATLTPTAGTPVATSSSNTFRLTEREDIQNLGGEGATVARLVGRMLPFGCLQETTPVPRFLRWAVYAAPDDIAGSGPSIIPDLWAVAELSRELYLLTGTTRVTGLDLNAAANDFQGDQSSQWIEIDTQVRRRLDEDEHLFITFQFSSTGGQLVTTWQASGFFRLLLMSAMGGRR